MLEQQSSLLDSILDDQVRAVQHQQQQAALLEKVAESTKPQQPVKGDVQDQLIFQLLRIKTPEVPPVGSEMTAWSDPEELDRVMQETRGVLQIELMQKAAKRLLEKGLASIEKGQSLFSSLVLSPKPVSRETSSLAAEGTAVTFDI
jgi:hypothetical protein